MHEVFEHTADLGLRVCSPSLTELFSEAGYGLFELMVDNLESIRANEQHSITLQNDNLDLLFFDWLNELLYLFDAKHLVLNQFAVTLTGNQLTAMVSGEPRDDARHQLNHEVKAITYHQLQVLQQEDGSWQAEVILDI